MKIENKILEQHINNNKVSHSYLIVSDNENLINRETQSFILNIIKNDSSRKKFISGSNADILEIYPENKIIKIDQIRQITKFLSTAPIESEFKIVLIHNGEYFRKESANALLKILEDPPVFAKIIITTNNEMQIISTIISRCQVIKLMDDSSQISESNIEIDKELNEILTNTINRELLELVRSKNYFNEKKEDAIRIYNYLYNFFQDLYIFNNSQNVNNLSIKNNIDIYRKINVFNNGDLINIINKIGEIKEYFKVNINFQIANEELLLYIMEEQNGRSSRSTV